MKAPTLKSKMSIHDAAMQVAQLWGDARSKDPSTKVGACIYDPRTGGLFLGYNGFPAGVKDLEEVWNLRKDDGKRRFDVCAKCGGRGEIEVGDYHSDWSETCPKCKGSKVQKASSRFSLTKYDLVIHAEQNAVRKALLAGVDLTKAVLICTLIPCPRCMLTEVLAHDIKVVLYNNDKYNSQTERDVWLTNKLASLGGVSMWRTP